MASNDEDGDDCYDLPEDDSDLDGDDCYDLPEDESDLDGDASGNEDDDLNIHIKYCSEDEDGSSNGNKRNRSCSYTILSRSDIQQCQEELIKLVSTTLSISPSSSTILLRHYNWDVDTTTEKWFADEARVREVAGLPESPVALTLTLTCMICFDDYPSHELSAAACGHSYCRTCWTSYISNSINDGPGCLLLRCPDPSCHAAIGRDMVDTLADEGDRARYAQYLTRSYVENSKRRSVKWCPSPGCELAVDGGGGAADVRCDCSYVFCWNCTEESHRPVKCDLVAKWIAKSTSEGENSLWLLANSKPCPKCKRPIEKNQGCMHMLCVEPCNHHFCWLCLGPWEKHGPASGGFYACNGYKENPDSKVAEKARKEAREAIDKYTHFYDRWLSNHRSRLKAMEDLRELQETKLEALARALGESDRQVSFISDAWNQIIECRRVLKWAYAYGYYLMEERDRSKRRLFEHLQGEAEAALERLHQCAEKDMEVFFEMAEARPSCGKIPEGIGEFGEIRKKLSGFTNATRTFFQNLVRALENGLEDVVKGGSNETEDDDDEKEEEVYIWYCNRCTFANPMNAPMCQMCEGDDTLWV